MNHNEFEKWLETIQRRPLSPAEQSQLDDVLARNPDRRLLWLQEIALTRLLVDLPDAPLPPDFTRRVLTATDPTAAPASRAPWRFGWPHLPRPALGFALAGLVVLFGGIGFLVQQHRAQSHLVISVADLSRQIELVANATDLPAVQVLQDFEAIYHLSQTQPLADDELLAALQ
ncbi:MAG: hypothetical protein KJ072_14125 [Verrucomicrobia bacterium]|nr:hypothetical protein [Verrucomicrobiota bacterium]